MELLSSNVDLQDLVLINFILLPLRLNDYKTFENCLECKEIIKADLGENFSKDMPTLLHNMVESGEDTISIPWNVSHKT